MAKENTVKGPDYINNGTINFPKVEEVREPLSSIQTYCQSKTFIANSGVNPLVAAASALFSLNSKFALSQEYENIASLRSDLVHEIKAFECAAQTHNYHPEVILLARYAICAMLDETILNTLWGQQLNWQENTLLFIFQGENFGGESFFYILDKLIKNPANYIDLLEFMYICLSLGFQGKYRGNEHEQNKLDITLDHLFHIIRKQRGDFSPQLSAAYHFNPKKPQRKSFKIPLWAVGSATIILLVTLYFGFNYIVEISATPLYNKLASLSNAMDVPHDEDLA